MEQKAEEEGHEGFLISSSVDFIIIRIIGFAILKTVKRIKKLGGGGEDLPEQINSQTMG